MNKDVTQQVSQNDSEKLSLILTTVQSLTVRFDNVDARFNNIDSRLLHVDQAVNELREGQRELREGQQQLQTGHLHLHETVLQIQHGQRQLQEGQEFLTAEVRALRRSVDYRFMRLSGTTLDKIRELDTRVTRLELNSHPPDPQT